VEVRELFRAFAAQVKTGIVCGPGVAETLRTINASDGVEWVEASDTIVERGDYSASRETASISPCPYRADITH
jgi:hypothetical protein